jgi:hypothetical protein
LARRSLGGCAVVNETQTCRLRDTQDRIADYLVATCRFPPACVCSAVGLSRRISSTRKSQAVSEPDGTDCSKA